MLGDGGVGKTSLKNRYVHGQFTDKYLTTLGVDFASHSLTLDGKQVFIQIWDIAGQDSFASIRNSYFQGAKGALIVFDVTRPDTFERVIDHWIRPFYDALEDGEKTPLVILGNKADLTDERILKPETGQRLVEKIKEEFNLDFDVPYLETSAKESANVIKAFELITRLVIEKSITD